MVEKPSKLQPALIGGVILGVLSSIPFVNFGNCLCCMWILIGGAIAARTLINRSPVFPVSSGDGAGVGAIAGAIGSAVYLVLGIPLGLLMPETGIGVMRWLSTIINDPNFRAQMEQAIRQSEGAPMAERIGSALISWLVFSVLCVGFATLGGVIGVALFEKRKGQQIPPPPPQPPYGGGVPPQY